jgi:hypothetical protein
MRAPFSSQATSSIVNLDTRPDPTNPTRRPAAHTAPSDRRHRDHPPACASAIAFAAKHSLANAGAIQNPATKVLVGVPTPTTKAITEPPPWRALSLLADLVSAFA